MLTLLKNISRVHIFHDPKVDLIGCIAISKEGQANTAVGGTRLASYSSLEEAITDSVRLAESMTKKCLVADVPFAGGKAVLLKPHKIDDINAYFKSYGEIIESLNGNFITGCDVGVSNHEMQIVKSVTGYVTGLSDGEGRDHLSYLTALGVYYSMKTCLKRLYNINSLNNIRVAIQGVGKVGRELAQILCKEKADVTIYDINTIAATQLADKLNCRVSEKDVLELECDILAPCALGGLINHETIDLLKCKIICGAANNQLYDNNLLAELDNKNIFFFPDWICNIGGAIYAVYSYLNKDLDFISQMVEKTLTKRTEEFINLKYNTNSSFLANELFLRTIAATDTISEQNF